MSTLEEGIWRTRNLVWTFGEVEVFSEELRYFQRSNGVTGRPWGSVIDCNGEGRTSTNLLVNILRPTFLLTHWFLFELIVTKFKHLIFGTKVFLWWSLGPESLISRHICLGSGTRDEPTWGLRPTDLLGGFIPRIDLRTFEGLVGGDSIIEVDYPYKHVIVIRETQFSSITVNSLFVH